jgi:hypothetical protein
MSSLVGADGSSDVPGRLGSLGSPLVVPAVLVVVLGSAVVLVLVLVPVLVLVLGSPGLVGDMVVGFGAIGSPVVGGASVVTGVDEASSLVPVSVPSLSRVRTEHAGSVAAVNRTRSDARAR